MDKKKNRGELSREKIIEAAIELFSEKGFSGTSVQEIADTCGISQTTIFYHYKNKKILFSEILKYVISNNRNIFEQMDQTETEPFETLVHLLEANMEWCLRFPGQTKMLLLLFQFATSDEDIKELATETIDKGRELVKNQLIAIQKSSEMSKLFEIDELAIIIQQYVNAAMFQLLVRNDHDSVYDSYKKNLRPLLKKLIYN